MQTSFCIDTKRTLYNCMVKLGDCCHSNPNDKGQQHSRGEVRKRWPFQKSMFVKLFHNNDSNLKLTPRNIQTITVKFRLTDELLKTIRVSWKFHYSPRYADSNANLSKVVNLSKPFLCCIDKKIYSQRQHSSENETPLLSPLFIQNTFTNASQFILSSVRSFAGPSVWLSSHRYCRPKWCFTTGPTTNPLAAALSYPWMLDADAVTAAEVLFGIQFLSPAAGSALSSCGHFSFVRGELPFAVYVYLGGVIIPHHTFEYTHPCTVTYPTKDSENLSK